MSDESPPTGDDRVLPAVDRSQLRGSAFKSARWLVLSRGITEAIAFVSTFLLARLVSPDEFGAAAAALLMPALADILLYEGFATALVRRDGATVRDARIALTLSLVAGLSLAAATYGLLATPWAGDLLGAEEVDLLQLACLAFVISAPNAVPQARLERLMAFKTIGIRESIALFVSTAASVALAIAGAGGYAIIGGLLIKRVVTTLLTQFLVERVRPGWDRVRAREILGFGGFSSLAGIFNTTKRNIDYLVLGLRLSPADVGFYYRAYSTGVDYSAKINVIITRLALPVYSRARDPADMWALRRRVMRIQMSILVPIFGTFAAVAAYVIPTVYGEQWTPSVLPAQILMLVPILMLVQSGNGPMLLALGRAGWLATINGTALVAYVVVVLVAAPLGLIGVCVVIVAFNFILALIVSHTTAKRLLGFSVLPILQELAAPLVCILPTAALAFVLPRVLDPSVATTAPAVLIAGGWMALTFSALMRLLFPDTWRDVSSAWSQLLQPVVRRLRRRGAAA